MEDLAELAIERMLKLGAEFADLRLEMATATNVLIMDGKTKTLMSLQNSGCGLRAFTGGAWGFASASSLTSSSIKSAAESAVKMAKAARARTKLAFKLKSAPSARIREEYRCKEKPSDVPVEEKLEFIFRLDKAMSGHDSRIISTSAKYDDMVVDRVVANSFGTLARTRERWLTASCSAWAKSESTLQRGHSTIGSVGGYELMRTSEAESLGDEAATQAIRLLDSKPVPAGKFTCILDNKMTGMLAHEAFGHACEADAILAGASVLENKLGKQVACEQVDLVDDPTVENTFGFFSLDWEGVKARKHVLIKDGILKGFLHNLETSGRMGLSPNGASRSQMYSAPPIIRMSNTYVGPGDVKKDELFEETKRGLLIQGSQYGYVEPAKGQFMFKCDEAYDIVNGEIGQRYRDASISGLIMEVLHNVEAVGSDFTLTDPGYCGKSGQAARTTDGGPHLRVTNMVVGGLA